MPDSNCWPGYTEGNKRSKHSCQPPFSNAYKHMRSSNSIIIIIIRSLHQLMNFPGRLPFLV